MSNYQLVMFNGLAVQSGNKTDPFTTKTLRFTQPFASALAAATLEIDEKLAEKFDTGKWRLTQKVVVSTTWTWPRIQ